MCSTSTLFLPCVLCVHVLLIVSTVSASSSGRLIAVTAKYHVRTRIPVSILASIRRTHTHTHARTPPQTSHIHATRSPWALFLANMGLTHFTTKNDSVQFNSHLFLSPIIIHFFLFFWLFEINGFVEDTVNIDDFPDESSWFCCARRCPQSWLTWPRRQLDYSKLQVRLLRCVLRAALHFPFLRSSCSLFN